MKKQGKTSRADEGDKPLKDCLIPRIVQKLLIWALSKLHGTRQENIKIQLVPLKMNIIRFFWVAFIRLKGNATRFIFIALISAIMNL